MVRPTGPCLAHGEEACDECITAWEWSRQITPPPAAGTIIEKPRLLDIELVWL